MQTTYDAATEARLRALGQEHLLAHAATLDGERLTRFRSELAGVNWDEFAGLKALLAAPAENAPTRIEPPAARAKGADPAADREARKIGEDLLRRGAVGVFVVAGGQGSRLGYEGPKGCYPATAITRKPLFRVFAEKILALRKRYGAPIPWYVMTSRGNHEQTTEFFSANDHFGLPLADVFFLTQDMVPAVDALGRILIEEPGRIFQSPNGHGGSLLALARSGALDDMERRGVEQIFYFQVDNPLVEIADPVFLGYHSGEGAEMSSKVVAKRNPEEKVGVVALLDGRFGVIEYSDLPSALRYAKNADGSLRFNDGSIAIHFLRRDFVRSVTGDGLRLPFHLARKAIPSVDPVSGERSSVQGVKFETFVFDALGFCKRSVVFAIDRADEFAPIKNATGDDSPATCHEAQSRLFARWLNLAGAAVPVDATGLPPMAIEISPLYADGVEALIARRPGRMPAGEPIVLA